MLFDDLLSRCDTEVFQKFLGDSCTRLLALLDSKMSSPAFLRRLVMDSLGANGLLQDASTRNQLLPLLRPEEAARLCVALGIEESLDPYSKLRDIAISRGSARESALFNFFELKPPVPDATEVEPSETPVPSGYPLFEHQRRASRKVLGQIRTPPHRVLLHMPTGSGKTRTAMNVISDHLRSSEPTVVIWLASSEELCDQAADEFMKAWFHLGDRTITLKRFWGHHQLDLNDFHDGILIAGLPKLIRLAERDFIRIGELGTRSSLVVLDEAHQAVAPQYRHVIEALLAHHSNTGFIGLSATPGRTWNDISIDEELAIFFTRRKVGLEIPGYANPVDYLVDKGYLAKANFTPLLYQPGFRLSDNDLQKLRNSLDVPENILERLGEDEKRNLAIITKIEEMAKRHRRIIVFASSVSHAHLVSNVLRARGHDASAITTRTGTQERARDIEAFKSKKPNPIIVCNYGVLTTGFDAPQTSCAVIARPTKSLVLYSQMVGRAIRGTMAGGSEQADIVTVIDQQLPGFGGVADAFSNWEDIWTVPVK
jgi:superfamily II DNA or RNA helicase